MNILQILPSLDVGGVETGTVDLARYIAAHGHRAIVVSAGGRLVKRLDARGVRHYSLPVGRKNIFTMARMVGELVNIIRSEDIDIVHARSRIPAITAFLASRVTGKVFITTAHGYYKKHFLSAVMGWGKYVIVASNIIARRMTHDFGVPHERIRLIPRGVDLKLFRFRDPDNHEGREFVIGMVARITPLKGHADFIKAVAIVRRHIPNLKVLIVGDAPRERYLEDLKLLTRRLGLDRMVEFTGSQEDIPSVMKRLDILVSATITPEAFGRAIIEAQAAGVAVVATKVGGVVDIIEDAKNALLCAVSDPKDMAEKILKLYRDKPFGSALVIEARRRVEVDFNLENMMTKTLALYEEALRSLNILVIKMSAMGDVILSIPSLRAIRSAFPASKIIVLTGTQAREVIDRCPYINDRMIYDHTGKDISLSGLLRTGGRLRRWYFDIAIDLQNNKKSHVLAYLSGAPFRYGYDNGKLSFLLNRRIKDDAPYLDPVEHQFRVLKLAGAKPQDKNLELWPTEADEKKVDEFLNENWVKPGQELVGINVRASSRWHTKNWPASHIAGLCDALAREFGIRVVLTGVKEDIQTAGRIVKETKSKPMIAVGRTGIFELASLMRRFKVYLTADSAPMHIAAAMGTPFVALFGPTDPARHVVRASGCVILKKDLKCSPCYSPRCMKKSRCMNRITVEEVLEAMSAFLKRREEG